MPSKSSSRLPILARMLVVGAMALVQASCVSTGRPATLLAVTQVEAPRGMKLHAPAITLTANGANVRGFVCRGTAIIAPTHVQLERIGLNGAVISTHRTRIAGLAGRAARCSIYNFKIDWSPQADEQLRIGAPYSRRACRQAV